MKPRAADGTTLQVRVLRVLRTAGSFDADRIAQRVGVGRGAAHTACRYLIARGLVEHRKMAAKWVIYRALPGRREPDDRRGKPAACRNSRYSNVLAMMLAKCGPAWRPKSTNALESAWPFPAPKFGIGDRGKGVPGPIEGAKPKAKSRSKNSVPAEFASAPAAINFA